MTRDEAEARGRRALAAGFVWWHGVLALESRRRISWSDFEDDQTTLYHRGGLREGDRRVRPDNGPLLHNDVPDFRDAATVGALRAQVAERYSTPMWTEFRASGRWEVYVLITAIDDVTGLPYLEPDVIAAGPTEVDALLAALEVGR